MFDPDRWGLPARAVAQLGEYLHSFWERYRPSLRTRTRDTSEYALTFWRGQLTMEDQRTFANIDRRVNGQDGRALQHFMSESPWSAQAVFQQIQQDIRAEPALQTGGRLILDESPVVKAGPPSAGAARQHNGRVGKIELSQIATCLAYVPPATGTGTLGAGELFLPEVSFTRAYAAQRAAGAVPAERTFATKLELGQRRLERVHAHGLPFQMVACDEFYGRSRELRAKWAALGLLYAAQVPAATVVYFQPPIVKVPRRPPRANGRPPTRGQVQSRQPPHTVCAGSRRTRTVWQHAQVRPTERGAVPADFVVMSVWTITRDGAVRAEWLVIRRDPDGRLTYSSLNGAADTPAQRLIERSCWRFFAERTFQDAKSELGWDDFPARKYRTWEHEMALTAAATWFIAGLKLNWRRDYPRDPAPAREFELEVLPALSTANVRDLLMAALPLPEMTTDRARDLEVTHLVHRARSTSSRLQTRQKPYDSS